MQTGEPGLQSDTAPTFPSDVSGPVDPMPVRRFASCLGVAWQLRPVRVPSSRKRPFAGRRL